MGAGIVLQHAHIGVSMFLLCSVWVGCGRREPIELAPEPLARVGNAVITEADFEYELQRRMATGRPLGDAQTVLGELIEREAMLQEAVRDPRLQEPDVRRERENQLLAQWFDRTLQEEKRNVTVTDDELRAAYHAHPEAHASPALMRLAILYREVPSSSENEALKTLSDALRSARQTYLDDPAAMTRNGRIPGFGAIAAEASEDTASRYRGGDLGWLDSTRGDYRWPSVVMETGFALPIGGVSDVVNTEEGLYVVMKQDERQARVTPFEEATLTLRRRLLLAKQEATEACFKSNVLSRTTIVVNRERAMNLRIPAPQTPALPIGDLLPVAEMTNTVQTEKRALAPESGRELRYEN